MRKAAICVMQVAAMLYKIIAHQVVCERTTADVRVHSSCCATDEPIFFGDLS